MSDTTCPIRSCDVRDIAKITRLLDTVFQIRNPAKDALIRWKYFAPWHDDHTVMYAALNDSGDFVSQYANIPVTVRYGADPLPAMICADMATHPGYRGRGLISALARRVYPDVVRDGAALSIGFSNQEGIKVDQNANGYGYRTVGMFRRYAMLNWPNSTTPYSLERVDQFSRSASSANDCQFRIDKSAAYLNWRYRDKPANDYQLYQVTREDQFTGYVVIRETPTLAYIYDLIADESQVRYIIPAIQRILRGRGKPITIWYVLNNAYWRQTLSSSLAIPSAWRATHYYLTVRPHSAEVADLPALCDPERWHMMAGDIL